MAMRMTKKLGNFCRFGLLAMALCAALLPQGSHAFATDRQIDQARLCTQHFPRNERLYGIPTHLMAAVASTESGRWNDTLGMVIPWPWTLNSEGKGFYFNTKAEAVAKVKALQRQGVRSIDVGCMQVNLKHHPRAFTSVEEALDPQSNVNYAASFLRSNYDDLHSWTLATAAYHSRTPVFGRKYLGLIEKSWNNIVGKVRQARLKRDQGGFDTASSLKTRQDEQQFASLEQEFRRTGRSMPMSQDDLLAARSNGRPASATTPVPRRAIKVIQVRDAGSRRGQTMIVRPTAFKTTKTIGKSAAKKDATPSQIASADRSQLFVTSYGTTPSRRASSVSSGAPRKTIGASTAKAPAPKYIFVD